MNRSALPPEAKISVRRALLAHYDAHKRDLPWRGESDPYRILVSEVMLQQTRVQTVLSYYGAWLGRFPDMETLAAAHVDDVMQAWEGLGYYRRARNLHRTAQVVRERPAGTLPSTYAELRELPGLGEYTAGAVASIAFGEMVAAPDGNVKRVLARLFDEPDPKPAWIRATAADLVDPDRPGDWNQALMELGATVCTPRSPRCGDCPVEPWCASHAGGTQEDRPAPVARRALKRVHFALAVLHCEGRVLLVRRPPEGLLGGMWAFPEAEVADAAASQGAARAILSPTHRALGDAAERLSTREHRFTHLHATYHPYLFHVAREEGGLASDAGEVVWVELAGPDGVALPVAQRRILESARERLARGAAAAPAES